MVGRVGDLVGFLEPSLMGLFLGLSWWVLWISWPRNVVFPGT